MSTKLRLARVVAAYDQVAASAKPKGLAVVEVGAAEWNALARALDPLPRCSCEVRIPSGDSRGRSLAEVAAAEHGAPWLAWALRRPRGYWPDWFAQALRDFVAQHDVRRAA